MTVNVNYRMPIKNDKSQRNKFIYKWSQLHITHTRLLGCVVWLDLIRLGLAWLYLTLLDLVWFWSLHWKRKAQLFNMHSPNQRQACNIKEQLVEYRHNKTFCFSCDFCSRITWMIVLSNSVSLTVEQFTECANDLITKLVFQFESDTHLNSRTWRERT